MCGKQQGEGARGGPVMRGSCPPSDFRTRSRGIYLWYPFDREFQTPIRLEEPVSPHALWKGEDNQLKRARQCVTGKAAIAVQ